MTANDTNEPSDTAKAATAGNETATLTDAPATFEEPHRPLSPAARRALAEAEERRRQAAQNETKSAGEVGGRKGPDPTRFGDWEKDGIVSDF
ncbi:MAG: DUF1674 domain-containing protein [Hyphomicrobiaceae bacterium]|nr:DUF1674 domain-containing protein [Hyphomicrobiaceae bacterium]